MKWFKKIHNSLFKFFKDINSFFSITLFTVAIILLSFLIAAIVRPAIFEFAVLTKIDKDKLNSILSVLDATVSCFTLSRLIYIQKEANKTKIKDIDINEARFILDYNQSFIQDPKMVKVESMLERDMEGKQKLEINEDNRQDFINYLVYLEGIAPLINKGILRFDSIDNLMAYRYFLAVNNEKIQKEELFKYPEYYRGCFEMYSKWKSYRIANGKEILNVRSSLDNWIHFDYYAQGDLIVRAAKENDDVRKIARLIYKTDEYIYPAAFRNIKNAEKAICKLYNNDKKNIFSKENIIVAIKNDIIVGVAVVLTPLKDKEEYEIDIKKLLDASIISGNVREFDYANNEYFLKQEIKDNKAILLSLSVDEDYQNQHIGHQIMSYIVRNKSTCTLNIKLDVLEKNVHAINLYKKYGFKQIETGEDGFSIGDEKPKIIVMEKDAENKI